MPECSERTGPIHILASITTKRMSDLRARWKLQGGIPVVPGQLSLSPQNAPAKIQLKTVDELTWLKEGYVLALDDPSVPAVAEVETIAGAVVVLDWSQKRVAWESSWGNRLITPHPLCFADGVMYVGDLEGGHVYRVSLDPFGTILGRLTHPAFNDIHALWRTRRGLLVANSGTDSIVELSPAGETLWEWWAAEHGFEMTPAGLPRTSGRGAEHRNRQYQTQYHATHLNRVATYGEDDRYVLATLFHQGMLVRIDRAQPARAQRAEIVLAGLARPHGPVPFHDGWLVCNSLGRELVILDTELQITGRIPYEGGWIQDATLLSNGNVLLNDVDNHRLVELGGSAWHEIDRFEYPQNWRVAEIYEWSRAVP